MMFRKISGFHFAMLVTAVLLALLPTNGLAQERQFMRDKLIQAGDYDQFVVAGPGGMRACAETCANDPRCKAWTYIRPVNQCRLKHEMGRMVDNPCCVSGVKPDADAAEAGGKQAFCAEYARAAVTANAQNTSQGCQLQGARWSDDFQQHYSWCMSVHRDDAATESQARGNDIARCQQAASEGAAAKCDHYARISMVQVETARKAHCALPQDDRRWAKDIDVHRHACMEAPARVLATGIAEREAVLTTCLAAAGQAHEDCDRYADKAVEQVTAATANGCDVSGPRWSSSRAEQLLFCLNNDGGTRRAEAAARVQQVAQCTDQAAKRHDCDEYADAAMAQSARNANENCGFKGASWSRYKDEHIAFCMRAGRTELRDAAAGRDADLATCQSRASVDPVCDDFAKRAVKVSEVNAQRDCGLDGEIWSADYNDQYRFCVKSNPVERRVRMIQQRRDLFACSIEHGFKLELGF